MPIPQPLIRRALLSATASARARGRDARPIDIAQMLQTRYDKYSVHDISEWLDIARAAVNMVADAREIMDLLPLPSAGGPDNAIR